LIVRRAGSVAEANNVSIEIPKDQLTETVAAT
jgi:hypothetical protein